jgi:hypothetical protein
MSGFFRVSFSSASTYSYVMLILLVHYLTSTLHVVTESADLYLYHILSLQSVYF